MKNNPVIFYLGVISLLVALVAGATIAQAQGLGQGQVPGAHNFGPASQGAAAQIQALTGEISVVQKEIKGMELKVRQSLADLTKLRASRPALPSGATPEEKAAYKKNMADWQYQVTAKEHEVYVAHAQLDQLQQKLKKLQQELARLQ